MCTICTKGLFHIWGICNKGLIDFKTVKDMEVVVVWKKRTHTIIIKGVFITTFNTLYCICMTCIGNFQFIPGITTLLLHFFFFCIISITPLLVMTFSKFAICHQNSIIEYFI